MESKRNERLSRLRVAVCAACKRLPSAGLVVGHAGNVSGIDRAAGRVVIKPSGIDYDLLQPEDLVEVDLATGAVVDGDLRPSVDLPHHLFLYRNLPEIGGVVHTHSTYATAFAIQERAIPVCCTGIADVFGGEIPCAPYADNVADHIGRAILATIRVAPAVLLAKHGVFCWGSSVAKAIYHAEQVEQAARTVHLAMQLGPVQSLSQAQVAMWNDRFQHRYGQVRNEPTVGSASMNLPTMASVEE